MCDPLRHQWRNLHLSPIYSLPAFVPPFALFIYDPCPPPMKGIMKEITEPEQLGSDPTLITHSPRGEDWGGLRQGSEGCVGLFDHSGKMNVEARLSRDTWKRCGGSCRRDLGGNDKRNRGVGAARKDWEPGEK